MREVIIALLCIIGFMSYQLDYSVRDYVDGKIQNILQFVEDKFPSVLGYIPMDDVSVRTISDRVTGYAKQIIVISEADNIQIRNVIVNRGNCNIFVYNDLYPRNLRYGESMNLSMLGACNVMEVKVETNKGTGIYKFNKK